MCFAGQTWECESWNTESVISGGDINAEYR